MIELSPMCVISYYLMYISPDILFSSQGRIKKIKLYEDAEGKQKGDALVTYTSPESVLLACLKVSYLANSSSIPP